MYRLGDLRGIRFGGEGESCSEADYTLCVERLVASEGCADEWHAAIQCGGDAAEAGVGDHHVTSGEQSTVVDKVRQGDVWWTSQRVAV